MIAGTRHAVGLWVSAVVPALCRNSRTRTTSPGGGEIGVRQKDGLRAQPGQGDPECTTISEVSMARGCRGDRRVAAGPERMPGVAETLWFVASFMCIIIPEYALYSLTWTRIALGS